MAFEEGDLLQTIEQVYEAAANPEQWPTVLDRLCDLYPGGQGSLITHDLAIKNGICSLQARWDPDAIRAYNDYYARLNPRFTNLDKCPVGIATSAEAMCDLPRLLKTEFYNDFLRPQDVPSGLGVTLFKDQSRFVRLSVLYPEATAADQERNVALLQHVTPHLQRAMQVNRQLALADLRWQAAEASLDRFSLGVAIVGAAGRASFLNAEANRIICDKDGLSLDRQGCLRAAAMEDDRRLRAAVFSAAGVLNGKQDGAGGVVQVRRPSGKPAYSLLVSALRPPSFVLSAAGRPIAIFIADRDRQTSQTPELLAQSFDLTKAEARLVAALAQGETLAEYAERASVAVGTARWHLKQAMAKTETTSQSALVRLVLTGLAQVASEGDTPSPDTK